MHFYDLSQPIESGMPIFPGDPEPVIQLAEGALPPWRVSSLHIGSHTGTHIDAAAHFFAQGTTIDQYPLERFILTGVCISIEGLDPDQPLTSEPFDEIGVHISKGGAVLIRTGWDRYWGQEAYLHHPYLTLQAANRLVLAGVGLVGIDALNVDSTTHGTDDVHQVLLRADTMIVENLRGLEQLEPGTKYHFSFLPLKLRDLDGSPIRAVAWREGEGV